MIIKKENFEKIKLLLENYLTEIKPSNSIQFLSAVGTRNLPSTSRFMQ